MMDLFSIKQIHGSGDFGSAHREGDTNPFFQSQSEFKSPLNCYWSQIAHTVFLVRASRSSKQGWPTSRGGLSA